MSGEESKRISNNAYFPPRSLLLNVGENGVYVEDMQHRPIQSNTPRAQHHEKEEADMEMIETY